jgi:diguanylate cyclase (GGDEF)-like protein
MYQTIPLYIFSIVVLLILYISLRQHKEQFARDRKLFSSMLLVNTTLLIVDFIQISVEGLPGAFYLFMNEFSSTILYIIGPLLTISWFLYVDFYIHKDGLRLRKYRLFIYAPFLLNFVLGLLSPIYGFFFTISETNTYARGDLFYLNAGIMYFYLLLAMYDLIRFRFSIRKQSFLPLLLFALPPAIGGLLQVFFYGLLIIWPTATLSCLMVYVFVQLERSSQDYLTGLYNKGEYENYMKVIEKQHGELGRIAGCVIDLNRFKSINDTYGHDIGDLALKEVAKILQSTFRSQDFIARFGGDEFAVLLFLDKETDLEFFKRKLIDNVNQLNVSKKFEFEIHLSIGMDYFDERVDASIVEFMNRLDELMYSNKQATYRLEKNSHEI